MEKIDQIMANQRNALELLSRIADCLLKEADSWQANIQALIKAKQAEAKALKAAEEKTRKAEEKAQEKRKKRDALLAAKKATEQQKDAGSGEVTFLNTSWVERWAVGDWVIIDHGPDEPTRLACISNRCIWFLLRLGHILSTVCFKRCSLRLVCNYCSYCCTLSLVTVTLLDINTKGDGAAPHAEVKTKRRRCNGEIEVSKDDYNLIQSLPAFAFGAMPGVQDVPSFVARIVENPASGCIAKLRRGSFKKVLADSRSQFPWFKLINT